MKKSLKTIIRSISFLSILTLTCSCNFITSTQKNVSLLSAPNKVIKPKKTKSLDDRIYGLKYDPNKILS